MKFSEYFKLNRNQPYLDFVDIPLDTDLPVFLEPGAIKSLKSPWGNELSSLLQTFFDTVLRLIHSGDHVKAQQLLSSLNERNEFHLGYSSGESRGHGFGSGSAESVWSALSKSNAAVTGLLKDLEDTALLIPGIGTDMISDAVCNIIRGPLIKYTQDMCVYYGVPLTPDIASGPVWNPERERWEESLIPLPMTDRGKVILVPKILVRHRLTYQYDEYYRHYILPEMQHEHLQARSPLVEVLKDGSERVTKKALIEKYGNDKLAVVEQTKIRPNILQEYKDQKAASPSKPLTQEQFCEIESSELPDLDPLVEELKNLTTGRDTAGRYEDLIEKILSVIFYPSLCNPIKQHNIHDGRKRIDITYTNEAKSGFFYWLSMHYPCPLIFIECKNYGKEAGNPEIDQLAGRFSPSRGQVGLLICRTIENKDLMYQRCIDTAKDRRGYMLALDDEDIIALVELYKSDSEDQTFKLLRELWARFDRVMRLTSCCTRKNYSLRSQFSGEQGVIPYGKLWSFELNLQKKKKQHFVWRKYLKGGSENDSIYCLMDGRIFKPGLMGVGQERYFYKLKELTEAEINFIKAIIDQDQRPMIRELNHGWINFFNQVFKIRDLLDNHGVSHPEADKMLDVLVHNFEEDFHGRIESDAIKFLEMLYRKDLSFYDDDDELIEFLFFICQQYFRTQNIDSKVRAAIGSFRGFNVDGMWAVLRHTSATSVGFSLYQDRVNFRPVLIENTSNIPFVTGDQPIINTHAIGLSLEEIPSELEFYYPLTPKLALLLTSNPDLNSKEAVSIGEEKATMYNKFIHSQAGKQVYSSERDALEQLLNG